jgi:hypothetical protein
MAKGILTKNHYSYFVWQCHKMFMDDYERNQYDIPLETAHWVNREFIWGGFYNDRLKDEWIDLFDRSKGTKGELLHKYALKFYKMEPPIPRVFLTISPNWKGTDITCSMIERFKIVLNSYLLESNRYTDARYVLECGGEGNHLHAHVVAQLNKDILKSVESHLAKGNHSQQIRKYWKKLFDDFPDALKSRVSIHKNILRTDKIIEDKLNYLIEELKPEGHKNLQHPLCPVGVQVA